MTSVLEKKSESIKITKNDKMLEVNRNFYEKLWGSSWLLEGHNFNTWSLVQKLVKKKQNRLEIAPGLRPRLPIKETHFADISESALEKLETAGGYVHNASVCELPFSDESFDLMCALDIIEHVEDDYKAMAEISRCAKDDSILLLSTPLHETCWTPFDEVVGHFRRYSPSRLNYILEMNGFEVIQSGVFGMKPKSSFLVNCGMWFLKYFPNISMACYNRVLPHYASHQEPLKLWEGMLPLDNLGEIFMVCKRKART